jgi:integrase
VRLTEITVRNLPSPASGQKLYRDDSPKGFGVRVSQGGTKTFVLVAGRDRQFISIGRFPVIGLGEARNEAKRLLAERTLGKHQNPRATFLVALETYLSVHVGEKNKPGTATETTRILRKQFAALHPKQLADITTADVMRITDRMLTSGHPSAANHAFTAARAFFRWCVRRRYIPHSPLEGLERPASTTSRERVLSDLELRAVWRAADATLGSFGIIVKLLILTGQRRNEIGSLRAEWVTGVTEAQTIPSYTHSGNNCDVAQLVEHPAVNRMVAGSSPAVAAICLPANITKNKRSHTFPVGHFASTILSSVVQATEGSILFAARGSTTRCFNGWSKAKAQLDKLTLVHWNKEHPNSSLAPWTLHDLRRTYATNLQRLGIRLEVIEALLNHVSGTRAGIVGVYNRHRYEAEMHDAVTQFDEWFARVILAA